MSKKNIGIIITRIGGVDGVALETEKWVEIFKRLGHKVFILTGLLERELPATEILPELYLYHEKNVKEQEMAFLTQSADDAQLKKLIEYNTAFLEEKISSWIDKNEINVLISQNSSALPCHLSMGEAIKNIIEKRKVKAILHHHDFSWERASRYATSSSYVKGVIEQAFPPKDKSLQHVVINNYNKIYLKEHYGLEATYVPNVMDFEMSFAEKDHYNMDFRESIGIKNDDIVLAQVTRLVKRKGVETALELISKLNNPKVVLVITGNVLDESDESYLPKLKSLIKELNIESQVFFISDSVSEFRKEENNKKVYSLSDVYANSDACTYFSTYEGFGNAFVETMLARKPIFVNNYKPVYWPNIGSLGFKTVMLENNSLTSDKLEEIEAVLYDKKKQREIVDFNFNLAKENFSYQVLERKLKSLL